MTTEDVDRRIAELSPERRRLLAARQRRRPATAREASLAPAQERLWFTDRLEPGSPAHAVTFGIRLTGPLDVDRLTGAVNDVIARQPALRTVFRDDPAGPRQVVLDALRVPVPVVHAVTPADAERAVAEHTGRGFDLSTGPLIAGTLVATAPDDHLLLVSAHHIVFDGWSGVVFLSDLAACYGRDREVPPLRTTFADHVGTRPATADAEQSAQLDYWRARLADAPVRSTLPPDRPRPTVGTHRGAHVRFALPEAVGTRLHQVARSAGTTLNTLALAAFAMLLRQHTGQRDVVLGIPVARRTRTELEPLIGCFADTLVVRIDTDGVSGGLDLVTRVRQAVTEAYAHQDVSYARVVDAVGAPRSLRHNPLFQVMINVNEVGGREALTAGDVSFTATDVDTGSTDFDLFLTIGSAGGQLTGTLGYNTDLYLADTAVRCRNQLAATLTALAEDPDRDLASLTGVRRRAVSVLASFTAGPLGDPLALWSDQLRLPFDTRFAGFGQVVQHLLGGPRHADATVVLLRWDDWLDHAGADEAAVVADLCTAVAAFLADGGGPLLMLVCPSPTSAPDRTGADERLARGLAGTPGVRVSWPDERTTGAAVHDPTADELGAVPYTPDFFAALATTVTGWLRDVWATQAPAAERVEHLAEHLDTPAAIAEMARPAAAAVAADDHVAPRTPTEERLAALWAAELGAAELGVTTDFYALGGHSLLATRLLSRVRAAFGATVTVREFLARPTIAALAELLDERGPADDEAPIPRRDAEDAVEPSSTQRRMLAMADLAGPAVSHHITYAATLRGSLDVPALRAAADDVVARHEVLRTTYVMAGGQPRLTVHDHLDCWLPDGPDGPDDNTDGNTDLATAIREHVEQPYDPARGPLLRLRLLRGGPVEHHLLIGMHHLICDNQSWHLLLADLSAAYRARTGAGKPLPPLTVQFADFAAWERARLDGPETAEDVAFWAARLADAPRVLALNTGPAPAMNEAAAVEAAECVRALPAGLGEQVRACARRLQVTPFAVLLTGFAVLLHQESGQEDLVVGVPTAGRDRAELADLVGYFADLQPLRLDLSGRPSARRLVRRAHETVLAAQRHRQAPFAAIVDAVRPPRIPGQHPLFQHVLNVVDEPASGLDLPGVTTTTLPVPAAGTEFALFLHLQWTGADLSATAEYRTDVLTADHVERLIDRLAAVLSELASEDPAPLLTAATPRPALTVAATGQTPGLRAELDRWTDRLGAPLAVQVAPTGRVFGPLLDPGGPFRRQDGVNVVALCWRDLLPPGGTLSLAATVWELEQALAELMDAMHTYRAWSAAPLVLLAHSPQDRVDERLDGWLRAAVADVSGVEVLTAGAGGLGRMAPGSGGTLAVAAVRRAYQAFARPVPTVVVPATGWAPDELDWFRRTQERHGREVRTGPDDAVVLHAPPDEPVAYPLPNERAARRETLNALWPLDFPATPPPEWVRPEAGLSFPPTLRAELADRPAARGPRDDEERALAAIYADLLHLDPAAFGVHDDFFDLGGDSMLVVQAVFRATERGLRLTPQQFSDRRTIAAQAELARNSAAEPAELTAAAPVALTGDVPLTPAQLWFLAEVAPGLPNPARYNNPYYLEIGRTLPVATVRAAVEAVVARHDALRLRLVRDETAEHDWRQSYGATVPFESHDVSTAAAPEDTVARLCAARQASLDLAGPLARAVHFVLPAGLPDRLLLVLHHLVTDGISRDVLVDDLRTACEQLERGEPVRLPAEGTSYQEWARRLVAEAGSAALLAELPFWSAQARPEHAVVPRDRPGVPATFGSLTDVHTTLSPAETAALRDISRDRRTTLFALTVWAVADAVAEWTGQPESALTLVAHGRDLTGTDVDVSRTVGWFQTSYPFRCAPGAGVEAVAAALRAVPRGGRGWSLARYRSPSAAVRAELAALPAPEVSVNFAGHFNWTENEHGGDLLTVCPTPYGLEQDADGVWSYALDVWATVTDRRLRLEIRHSADVHDRRTVTTLLAGVRRRLLDLGAGTRTPERGRSSS